MGSRQVRLLQQLACLLLVSASYLLNMQQHPLQQRLVLRMMRCLMTMSTRLGTMQMLQ
jgi:hypothetical protein